MNNILSTVLYQNRGIGVHVTNPSYLRYLKAQEDSNNHLVDINDIWPNKITNIVDFIKCIIKMYYEKDIEIIKAFIHPINMKENLQKHPDLKQLLQCEMFVQSMMQKKKELLGTHVNEFFSIGNKKGFFDDFLKQENTFRIIVSIPEDEEYVDIADLVLINQKKIKQYTDDTDTIRKEKEELLTCYDLIILLINYSLAKLEISILTNMLIPLAYRASVFNLWVLSDRLKDLFDMRIYYIPALLYIKAKDLMSEDFISPYAYLAVWPSYCLKSLWLIHKNNEEERENIKDLIHEYLKNLYIQYLAGFELIYNNKKVGNYSISKESMYRGLTEKEIKIFFENSQDTQEAESTEIPLSFKELANSFESTIDKATEIFADVLDAG